MKKSFQQKIAGLAALSFVVTACSDHSSLHKYKIPVGPISTSSPTSPVDMSAQQQNLRFDFHLYRKMKM
jgi:hypothetical protein